MKTITHDLAYNRPRYSFGSLDDARQWLNTHKDMKAFTYNGGDICYIWPTTNGHSGIVVNASMKTATKVHPLMNGTRPSEWKSVDLSALRECGAL